MQTSNPRLDYLRGRYQSARSFVSKLHADIRRTHPGSKAFHRVLREVREAERDTILWEGRLREAELEDAA